MIIKDMAINLFGKTCMTQVNETTRKLNSMPDDARHKMRRALEDY